MYLQGLQISSPCRKEAGSNGCGRCWPGAVGGVWPTAEVKDEARLGEGK